MLELLQSQGFCPRVATWELTQACNMRCLHCDSRATENRSEELTPKQALRVCEELAEAECQCVTLTGGEPLLRQDWPDIARALVNAGIRVTMITNGQLFAEATADLALDVGIRQFLFSVDGLDLRSPSGSDDDEEGRGFWAGCNAGCSVVGIESNGNIKGCLSLPSARNGVDRFVEGNLRKRSFRDIWEDANAFAHNRQFDVEHLEGFCRTCEYSEVCRGGCTAAALAHSGHQNASRYCYHRLLQERDSTDSE